jgi:hypothetical protein
MKALLYEGDGRIMRGDNTGGGAVWSPSSFGVLEFGFQLDCPELTYTVDHKHTQFWLAPDFTEGNYCISRRVSVWILSFLFGSTCVTHHILLDSHPLPHGSTALEGLRVDPFFTEVSRSHPDTPHSVGLLWRSDRPVAETSTRQHTTFKRQIPMPPAGFESAIPARETWNGPSSFNHPNNTYWKVDTMKPTM